jgi:hypothetical protein
VADGRKEQICMAVPEYMKAGRLGFLALRGAHGDAFVLVLRVGVAGRNETVTKPTIEPVR